MKLKNTIIAGGLAALTLGACNLFPEYTETGPYSCEKFHQRIAAKDLTRKHREAVKYYTLPDKIQIEYTTNMSPEQAIQALNACEKAFKIKAEKEEQ